MERKTYGLGIQQVRNNVEDKIAALFEPDILSATQYFQNFRRKTFLQPEKRLILAVLEDAIHCFKNNVGARTVAGKKLFQQTEEWILQEDGRWPFSFENICDLLGISPTYLRLGLLRLKEQKLRRSRLNDWKGTKLAS
jgi:hypothetical protein